MELTLYLALHVKSQCFTGIVESLLPPKERSDYQYFAVTPATTRKFQRLQDRLGKVWIPLAQFEIKPLHTLYTI